MIISPTYGRCLFDAVFKVDHSLTVTVTQHPVQSGCAVADHAFLEPDDVSISIGMSDVMTSLDTIAGGNRNRSVTAYEALRNIAHAREFVTLVTRQHTYPNLVVTSISSSDDVKTMLALDAEISFQEVRVVQVAVISIQQTCASSKIQYEQPDTSAETSIGSTSGMTMIWDDYTPTYIDTTVTGSVATTPISSGSSGGSSSSSSTGGTSNSSALKNIADKIGSFFGF